MAGEAPAEEVHPGNRSPVNAADVSVAGHIGPVLGEDELTVGIVFDLPDNFEASSSFEPKIKAADPAE